MKALLVIFALVVISCDIFDNDVTGHWRGEKGPNLDYLELTLTDQKGTIVGTATIKRPGYSKGPGTVHGDRDKKDVNLTIEEEKWTFYFDGKVDGDKMKGGMKNQFWGSSKISSPESYTLKRE